MSKIISDQIKQLKQAIAELEAQRGVLGDAAVDAALVPSRQKLAELESQIEPALDEPEELPTRQRKLVTLLYMDVVGSTAMTQDLDPEDAMDIMDNAIARLAEPIHKHDGHVTRYTGDGYKAVFGDPVSRENNPEQAIRAGLEILDLSRQLAQEIEREREINDFQVRIGIDTGLAALGGITEGKDTVKGRVVNLANRIQNAAPPGGLLISHNTYRHVRGVFRVETREPITAKGFPEPVPVYLVQEIKPRAFRVQTRGVEGVETRMVGRRTELDTLKDGIFTAIEESEGHVVTISGEAGVGKSRLLYEFQNWLELQPRSRAVRFFQGRARQETRGVPYSLLRDLFAFRFQILDDDTGEQARNKIEIGFGEVFGTEEDDMMRAHILGQLLGYDFSTSTHLKGVIGDAEQLRNRGVMYLIQYFQALSQEISVVIFLEDIHWSDDSSLDVVSRIGEFSTNYPILIVCACRPQLFERRPYWGEGLEYHKLIELRPLSKRESRQLVTEILKLADDIPVELRELIVKGAEGNPFYMEELIKMLIEDGVVIPDEETWRIDLTRIEEVDVPSTLAGVLQARLDSLPYFERTVLQQASVVGRLFWDRIVEFIQAEGGNGGDPQLVPQTLTSLRNRELVYRHEESAFVGAVEYLFKHDVLREVTYESVLKRLRITYHGLVADWLIANSGDRTGEYNGLIAKHLLRAGRDEQAGQYFFQAGESALASYANEEADGYFRQILDLYPDNPRKADILNGLGEALYRQGQSEESKSIWLQAIDIYRELGDSDNLGDICSRLSWLLWYTEDHIKARNLCQESLKILENEPDSPGYARLLAESGRTALFTKEYDQVIPLCQQAIDMANRVGDLEVQAEATITLALHKDDELEAVDLLKEVAEKAEKSGLMRTAFRANNNIGALLSDQYINLESVKSYYLRSAEIANKIGDVEGMLFVINNIFSSLIDIGELNTVEEQVVEILRSSSTPETRIKKFLRENRPYLLFHKGRWIAALEAFREIQKDFTDKDNLERMSDTKWQIAYLLIELNRLGFNDDLSDAERMLLENLENNLGLVGSNSGLVFVYIRQGKLEDAYTHLSKTRTDFEQSMNKTFINYISPWIDYEFATAEERWDDAIAISESMLETYQHGGYHYNSARWLIVLGEALVGRNEPGDLERARETYQKSLDMFTKMGAPGYVKVLEERLGNMQLILSEVT